MKNWVEKYIILLPKLHILRCQNTDVRDLGFQTYEKALLFGEHF